jgi:hypothetical protein
MSIAATELVLYINNTPALTTDKEKAQARMAKKKRLREYDRELGVRTFRRVADAAAKAYAKRHKLTEPWNRAFSICDRDDAAVELERDFRDLEKAGLLEYMLPQKLKKKTTQARAKWKPGASAYYFTGGKWQAVTIRSVSAKGRVSMELKSTGQKRSVAATSPKLSKSKRNGVIGAVRKAVGSYRATRRTRACPVGTKVQTLIFDRQLFTVEDAKGRAVTATSRARSKPRGRVIGCAKSTRRSSRPEASGRSTSEPRKRS